METAATHTEGFIQARQPWLRNAGIFSLFLYAFFWLLDIEISRIGESLMFLFFVIMLFTNKPKFLLREPIPYLLFAWVIFQIAMYQWAASRFPSLAVDHINEARTITNVFMFLVVAWWLGGNTKRISFTLFLCVIGFVLGATFQSDGLIDEWNTFGTHKRWTLGYRNWEHASVYSSLSLMVLVFTGSRAITYIPKKYQKVSIALIFIMLAFSLTAIIFTQTRATWLGLVIAASAFCVGYTLNKVLTSKKRVSEKNKKINRTLITTLIAVVILSALLSSLGATKIVTDRLDAERTAIDKLLTGDLSHTKITSVRMRIISWQAAYEWIVQRPITGWGPQTRKQLILQDSNFPARMKKKIGHLHNSYIELLVSYGIVGFSLYFILFFYVWIRAWQAWRAGSIPNDIMLFAAIWTIYWLIVNCFESYIIFSSTGNYLNALIAGTLYSYHLKQNYDMLQRSEHAYTRHTNRGKLEVNTQNNSKSQFGNTG